jgi:sterol 22-desaturase
LQQYAQAQEQVAQQFLTRVAATAGTINARLLFRTLAAASSQEAFLGPYLTDSLLQEQERDILTFTLGFLSFPCPWFGRLRRAMLAKDRIEQAIMQMVPQARQYMLSSDNDTAVKQPRCLLDRWCTAIHEASVQHHDGGPVPYCDYANIARTVLDFLFAAQDATNSALTFALDVLDAHRDVWDELCRCETVKKDEGAYAARVANQLLHHKPPVPMIPHLAQRACELGGRRIPKGTIVIPSMTYSARASAAPFMAPENDGDRLFVQTVVFEADQRKYPGRRYAESLLVVVLRILARDYAFQRTVFPRPTIDEVLYYPTTFPRECSFRITKKEH